MSLSGASGLSFEVQGVRVGLLCAQLEQPDFGAFYRTPKPKFFIFEQDDVSLLLGTNRWLDFAARLQDGAGPAAVIRVTGDHQGMLTRPASIAQGILQAATAPLL